MESQKQKLMNTDITQTLCNTLKVLSNAINKTKNELKLKPIVGTSPFSNEEQNTTSIGGGSMKSKDSKSLIPIALSDRIVLAKFVLWISGTAVGSISSLYARSVYSR